jgi:hypothetical protein
MKHKADLSRLSVDDLLSLYRNTLFEQYKYYDHQRADGRPDVSPWNRLGKEVERIHRAFKAHGDAGVDALLSLIHDPNPNVRLASISHCLKQRTDIVLQELEFEAENYLTRPLGLYASVNLDLWRGGYWEQD